MSSSPPHKGGKAPEKSPYWSHAQEFPITPKIIQSDQVPPRIGQRARTYKYVPLCHPGKQKAPREPTTSTSGPSREQAKALLKIRDTLDNNDFEKHAELMTTYLLCYNPEKMKVIAVERTSTQEKGHQPNTEEHGNPRQETLHPETNPVPKDLRTATSQENANKKQVEPKKQKPAKAAKRKIPLGRPLSDDEEVTEPTNRGGDFVENRIEFADGKIRKIKGYVPILMFNKAWLEANQDIEGKKTSKKKNKDEDDDLEDEKYEGLTYPSKLQVTYGDWVTCFNLFLDCLEKWFQFKKLVRKFEEHKRNVEKVKSENDDNWMVVLRYDIMIRRQLWTTRVEGGKVGDPSV
ncbi:uncharacterized protein MELLADRAFT_66847 [Melampsora larici-populina 98AG31]|uniref:Uncharacterized protein n=1 Tax=Melampsora larici-populina (strain 98AG31 / pathotype 3-4-7) TaxID=747676 RepID=F4S0T6_MELLP|nr:uncharacterized protein MELLADRAFT_66847 [Melampsora larici-populina 98AG31]EGG01642.1 hypothetical protein MELLADRAFT_66847 [Melampsora larici-populina 98AG31]